MTEKLIEPLREGSSCPYYRSSTCTLGKEIRGFNCKKSSVTAKQLAEIIQDCSSIAVGTIGGLNISRKDFLRSLRK